MSAQDFYSGILHCLVTVRIFDQPTMTDEIINAMSDKEQKALIRHAKKNEEYESSGLKQWRDEHPEARKE
jgi:beta-xylosidase